MDKIELKEVTFEAELVDSETDERLGAIVERVGIAEALSRMVLSISVWGIIKRQSFSPSITSFG